MGYYFANSSIRDYINNRENMKRLAEYLADTEPDYLIISNIFTDSFQKAFDEVLDEAEKRIFYLHYKKGMRWSKIAEIADVSPSYISKVSSLCFLKLATYFQNDRQILFNEVI